MSQPVEAVVFDWGGTLTPWHTVDLPEQWRVFAREVHGIPVESPDVSEADLEEAHRLADRILEAEYAAWKPEAASRAHLGRAGRHPARRGGGRRRTTGTTWRSRRTGASGSRTPSPTRRCARCGRGCTTRGIKVGVLSNTIWTREYHRGIFERDGVLDLLDADLYSSEIDHVKPHPEAFRAICRALDVAPRRAVYVGDRVFEDVHGPQQVGMRAIWIPHSDIPAAQRVEVTAMPDGHAHQLLDVLDIVDAWAAEA